MGNIVEQASKRRKTLASQTLIGRGLTASMRLSDPRVSSEHASILWDGAAWSIRDLASRNGTFVNGRRLESGQSCALAVGTVVGFGQEAGWIIGDTSAPVARATAPDGTVLVEADGFLCLPNAEDPAAIVYRDALGTWLIDENGSTRPGAVPEIRIGDVVYTLDLPRAYMATIDTSRGSSPEGLGLRIGVSLDEEHVQVEVRIDGAWTPLKPRAHHYLLLTLARTYLADDASGPDQRGWIHVDDLCKMISVRMGLLNMQVLRIRRELEALGLAEAAQIIERRPLSSTLRLAVPDVLVSTLT